MLSLTTTNRVTFAVNVFGTAASPSVRCVVGEFPAYSFPATKLTGGQYEVLIDLPKDLKPGSYPLKVEVLLNGRLFTPINRDVPVTGEEPVQAAVAPAAPAPTPAPMLAPTPAPAPRERIPLIPRDPAPAPAARLIPRDAPVMSAPAPSIEIEIPSTVENTELKLPEQPPMRGLTQLVNTPVVKPKLPEQIIKRIKINMAEIAADAEKLEPKKPKKQVKKTAPVIEARASIPVKLTKGAVIYREETK